MKGYRDTTKIQHVTGRDTGPKGAAKVSQVMADFKQPDRNACPEDRRPV